MLYPLVFLFISVAIVLLIIGFSGKSVICLSLLNILWWIGALIAAYFTFRTFTGRAYSENWEMIGFVFISLPILIVTLLLLTVKLVLLFKNKPAYPRFLTVSSLILAAFLIAQLIMGVLSA